MIDFQVRDFSIRIMTLGGNIENKWIENQVRLVTLMMAYPLYNYFHNHNN